MANDELRRGDLVEVKGPAEILATLDERGALEELPFMPEMAALCGQRFQVERRAERVCDTVDYSGHANRPAPCSSPTCAATAPRMPAARRSAGCSGRRTGCARSAPILRSPGRSSPAT
jgi:hypothetical protein